MQSHFVYTIVLGLTLNYLNKDFFYCIYIYIFIDIYVWTVIYLYLNIYTY